jgi:hypothetical protein
MLGSGEDEEPLGYLVPRPGRKLVAEQILSYMAEKTSKIKWITGGIIVTDSIPKNPVSSVRLRSTAFERRHG